MGEPAAAPAATSAAQAATSCSGGARGNFVTTVATSAKSAAQGGGDVGDASGDTGTQVSICTVLPAPELEELRMAVALAAVEPAASGLGAWARGGIGWQQSTYHCTETSSWGVSLTCAREDP
jgi:hypothetical protein